MEAKTLAALQASKPTPVAERQRYFKGVLYGDWGVGKTVAACSCSLERTMLVATDTGYDSLFNHPEILAKTDVTPYEGLSQLTALAEAAEERLDGYTQDLYVVDTISQIQEEYQDFLMENYNMGKRDKAQLKGGTAAAKSSGMDAELDVIGFGDYQLTRDKMRPAIKALIKAPVDVIFLAHLREPNFLEAQSGKITKRPTLTEAVFKLIAREASFMGLMEREGEKRTIQFATTKRSVSKSRIAALDNKTINADDLPKILQNWKEGK